MGEDNTFTVDADGYTYTFTFSADGKVTVTRTGGAGGNDVVEYLIDNGIPVPVTERNAIAALDDDVTEKLAPAQAAGDTAQMKQILREIAPETAPSVSSTATANAGAGVTFKVGGNTDIGVSYEGKFKKHYTDHTALLNVKYNF